MNYAMGRDDWKKILGLKEEDLDKPNAVQDKLLEVMGRADSLIEQVNNLYNQYLTGVEERPPTLRRQQLDQLMRTAFLMPKPNATIRYKFDNLANRFQIYKDKWERQLRDLELGKVKKLIKKPVKRS